MSGIVCETYGFPKVSLGKSILLKKIMNGNQSIVAQEICALHEYLFGFALKLTHDMEMAKDLLQDTVLKVLSKQDTFSDGTNLKAWSSTIMRNLYINDYRRAKITRRIMDKPGNMPESCQRAAQNDGECLLTITEIDGMMSHIKSDFVTPFKMCTDGFQYNEVADELHIPVGTVKSRVFQCRKILRASLS